MEGTSSLTARAIEITAWVRQLERIALHTRVNQSFVIAHSHYGDSIYLEAMSHGYVPGYEVHELEEMEAVVAPCWHKNVSMCLAHSKPEGSA